MNKNNQSSVLEILLYTLRNIDRKIENSSKEISISGLQYETLKSISSFGQCSMKELAISIGISMSSATQLILRLINLGLVKRINSTKDRRVVLVELTDLGTLQLKRIDMFLKSLSRDIFSKFTQENISNFLDMLENINKSLKDR